MSSNFDSYRIYYKTNVNDTYTYYDSSSAANPIISSLSPNIGYYIRLIPYSNTSGISGNPTDTLITTLPLISPQSFSTIDSSSIILNWTGSYKNTALYYSTDNSIYTYFNTYATPTTTATVNGLSANQRYYFKFTPLNTIDVSGTIKYITDANAVTSAKISTATINSATIDSSSITLNWTGSYKNTAVYYSTDNSTYTYFNTYATPTTTETVNGLSANQRYYFKFTPLNTLDVSGDVKYITDTNAVTSANISTATIDSTSIDSSSITLNWTGSYNKIAVYYSTDNSIYTYFSTYTSPTTTATVNGLSSNQRYYFKFTPLNTIDVSGTIKYITDANVVTSAKISDLSSTSTNSTITLNWTGSYKNMVIYYSNDSGSTYNYVNTYNSSTTTATITGLTASQQYYFKLIPINNIDISGTIKSYIEGCGITYVITGTYSSTSNTKYNRILSFTDTTTAATIRFNTTIDVSLIVVAGGGGGGASDNGIDQGGGGGGGGGVIAGTMSFNSGTTYTLYIGSRGSYGTANSANQTSGGNTYISDGNSIIIKSIGGGYGGGVKEYYAGSGGSGGGSTGKTISFSVAGGAASTSYVIPSNSKLQNYGNSGGSSNMKYGGGGGGGAGGVGSNATSVNGANGGNGYTWPVTGNLYSCGGGGAGGYNSGRGNGGTAYTGGGKGGDNSNTSGGNATYYGCGGGGSASGDSASIGGNGYQGVIIIAFN